MGTLVLFSSYRPELTATKSLRPWEHCTYMYIHFILFFFYHDQLGSEFMTLRVCINDLKLHNYCIHDFVLFNLIVH